MADKTTWIAAAVVVSGFAMALVGVSTRPAPPACPAGLRADPVRAAQLVALTRSTVAGQPLIDQAPPPLRLCFADEGTGVVRSDGVFVLAAAGDAAMAAARLGHLLHHQVAGAPLREPLDPARSCTDLVAAAMMAEAQAHALELQLRRELGVAAPLLTEAVDAEFWAAPAAERVGVIHRFLSAGSGPEGAPDLQTAYTRRCRSLRSSAPAP